MAKTVSLASLTPRIVDHLAALFRRGALIKRIHRFISFTGPQLMNSFNNKYIFSHIYSRGHDRKRQTPYQKFHRFSYFFFLDIAQDQITLTIVPFKRTKFLITSIDFQRKKKNTLLDLIASILAYFLSYKVGLIHIPETN